VIQHLRTEFSSRFGDICLLKNDIKLFSTPFDVQVHAIQEKYQLEVDELECSNELKSLLDFYKKYIQTISQLDQSCQKDGIDVWKHICV